MLAAFLCLSFRQRFDTLISSGSAVWTNAGAAGQAVAFGYFVATIVPSVSATNYTPIAALDVTSPVTGGSANALDGNLPASGSTTTHAQALGLDDIEISPWLPATVLVLR